MSDRALTPRRSLVFLVALVVAASVAATAHGLYAVAVSASVPWQVACLYPLITDGLALVAYWATKELTAAAYPWLVVVVAAGLSGLAQAVNLAGLGSSPTWLRFGVGFWPAVAVLLAAHLYWLVRRPSTKEETDGADRQGQGQGAVRGRQLEAGEPGVGPAAGAGEGREPAGRGEVRDQAHASQEALAAANGNGHAETLRAQAEREARRYLEENGVLPSENVLAGLARCSRGTARNALAPLRKG